MWLVLCALLAGASFTGTTLALRRRALGPRARPAGAGLLAVAFGSLFVGVLLQSPPAILPFAAWVVAGAGAALLRHAAGWRQRSYPAAHER